MVTHVNSKYAAPDTNSGGNSLRSNRVGTADDCYRAMQFHDARSRIARAITSAVSPERPAEEAPPLATNNSGDIIYGARSIAEYLFADGGNRARRRVFNLWAHYSVRKEKAGFFKLKGALCLSKSQWRSFHGLQ